jgi:LysM repeat protein
LFGAYACITTTNYTYARKLDNVVQTVIAATRTDNTGNPGKTTLAYDVNGYLTSITDEDKTTNNRSFINNTGGQVLQKTQQTNVLKNLVANGQVLGTYGVGVNQDKPAVVFKVKVQITMHVVSQSDGTTPTSEYDLTYTAGDKSSTTHFDDVDDGGEYTLTVAGVTWPPTGGTLVVRLSGKEVDPAAADDALATATLNIAASSWTTEGQAYTSATFSNGTATYYLKVKINADQSSPSYTDTVNNFNIAYQAVDAAHPGSGPGTYRVNAGDTLQGIALGAYGDRALWYLIADANGLQADAPLQSGQSLALPNTVGTVHNNAGTYRPYNVANIVGDTSPTLATPAGSSNTCQSVSIIIAAVVAAIVITVLATAATVATLGVLGVPAMSMAGVAVSMLFAAAGGAVASMASQGIMIAGGMQSQMNWSEVATGAVSGFATAGVGMAIGAASRAAVLVARNSRLLAMAGSAAEQGTDDAANAAFALRNLQRAAPRVVRFAENRSANMVKILGASDETEKVAKSTGGVIAGLGQKSLMQTRRAVVESVTGGVEGAASEILSQAMSQATGLRDDFDWKQVGLSALNPGTPASGAKLGAMADAEVEALRGMNRSTLAYQLPATPADRLKRMAASTWKVLKSTGTGFAVGFGSGIVKSSIYQGVNMATGNQQGFDTDAMLMFGYAGGVASAANKGLVAVGERRVDGVTARMDTRSFDWQRVGAATVGSIGAAFTLHGDDMDAARDSLALAQSSLMFDANVLGYVRAGRAL